MIKDNGWKSRKLAVSCAAMLFIALGWILTAKWGSLSITYPEFIAGILGAASIFAGSNVMAKHVLLKGKKE